MLSNKENTVTSSAIGEDTQVSKRVIGAKRRMGDCPKQMAVIGPNSLQVTQKMAWEIPSYTASP